MRLTKILLLVMMALLSQSCGPKILVPCYGVGPITHFNNRQNDILLEQSGIIQLTKQQLHAIIYTDSL